jgi:hypothetical protein
MTTQLKLKTTCIGCCHIPALSPRHADKLLWCRAPTEDIFILHTRSKRLPMMTGLAAAQDTAAAWFLYSSFARRFQACVVAAGLAHPQAAILHFT